VHEQPQIVDMAYTSSISPGKPTSRFYSGVMLMRMRTQFFRKSTF
jgi:hypothetical protein